MRAFLYAGLFVSIAVITGLAIFSAKINKSSKSKGNGSAVVAGLIMGTLVGGSSTVGTAQLAYSYGMSAWWFTLGAGIACLVLALFYTKALRHENCPTLVGMISKEYGTRAGMLASVLNSIGTFINMISQVLAASAVISVVFRNMSNVMSIALAGLFMVLYVIFGGTKGAGLVGILKLFLLYFAMVACGVIVIGKLGGIKETINLTQVVGQEMGCNFFNLFNRGFGKDLGACLSLILGVLTTQTYAQAVISAADDKSAKKGALMSAFLIPPIGICGILVGLYMRSVTDAGSFVPKLALTEFTLTYSGMPDIIAGVVLGALFIASVGTGAGLALGISNVVNRDIISTLSKKHKDSDESGLLQKIIIICIVLFAGILSCGPLGDTILNFSFMSMGLRGATVFAPLCFLLWAKGRVDSKWVVASIICGPTVILLFGTIKALKALLGGIDPLFLGVGVALLIMFIGLARSHRNS